jgi:6-phosphofructokinase 1
MNIKNAFYAQSGGVTSVINASACGVIQACREHPDKIGKVYAGRNGIIGALSEELIDTAGESDADIAALMNTPSGAFGSCRFKLKSLDENRREYERLIEVFKAHDIGITDNCPGFGSVAKYIAVSALEASFDVRSMAKTSTKVFVLEVMGRHAGWIAAAGGLIEDYGIPVLLLFPEIDFDHDRFIAAVQAKVEEFGYCTVVVSEGARNADGSFLAEQGSRDAFGHAQLGGVAPVVANMVKQALGHKFHWAVADYLQRAARHIASATDVEQAYALGRSGVEMALAGKNAIMPTIERISNAPYQWQIGSTDLAGVANVEKTMPLDFISDDGFGITDKCREYLYPLIQGEAYPDYDERGMPRYVVLKNELVARKLGNFKLQDQS